MSVIQELVVSATKIEEQERKWCEDDVRMYRRRLENMRAFLEVAGDLPRPDECYVGEVVDSVSSYNGSELAWRFGARAVNLTCCRRDDGRVRLMVKTMGVNPKVGKMFMFDGNHTYVAVADAVRKQICETEKWYEEVNRRIKYNNKNTDGKSSVIERLEVSMAESESARCEECESRVSCIRLLNDSMTQFWESADGSLQHPARGFVGCLNNFRFSILAAQLVWTPTTNRRTHLTCVCNYKNEVTFTVTTKIRDEDVTMHIFNKTFALGDNAGILECLQQQLVF